MSNGADRYLKPRVCHVVKWHDFSGYGFNLHAEKGKAGQFIGKVDEGSPAEAAGMKQGDRIVEVNGTNIGNENHQQVVGRIKAGGDEARLLVVDAETDQHYKNEKKVVKGDLPEVVYISAPSHDVEQDQNIPEETFQPESAPEPEAEPETTPESAPEPEPEPETETETTLEPEPEPDQEPEHIPETVEVMPEVTTNAVDQVPPSESSMYQPRLCHMKKWPDFNGYGFNLHAERDNPGQFIGKIDDGSPAEAAYLKEGDRIIEVNGVNIEDQTHQQTIKLVKEGGNETKLLVVDKETDNYFKSQGTQVTSSLPSVVYHASPDRSPQADADLPVIIEPNQEAELPRPVFDIDDIDSDEPTPAVEEPVEPTQEVTTESAVTVSEEIIPPPEPEVVTETTTSAENGVLANDDNIDATEANTMEAVHYTEIAQVEENTEKAETEQQEVVTETTENVSSVEEQVQVIQEKEVTVAETEDVSASSVNGGTTTAYAPPDVPTPVNAPEPTPEPTPVTKKQVNGDTADPIGGLSAKEMRERILSRKKQDPRNTKMNFSEKNNLFQRM